jgi:hypothetical protein
MKKLNIILLLLATIFSGCEKDDICSETTETTPRLIIDFYDITNPTLTKNVTNLGILGDGLDTVILFNGVSQVSVPLDITQDFSKYQFILNYNNTNPAFVNTDLLQFDYSRNSVFVSRACGYKMLFALNPTNPFTQTDEPGNDGLWMKNITVLQSNISNENETHLRVSF